MDWHQAAKQGVVAEMNRYLDDENFDIETKDENGYTALHMAAITGQCTAGSLLVESDAEIDARDLKGNTPLHMTAIHNHRLVTSMLMWGGADAEAQNHLGNTPLHEAAAAGAKDVIFLILDRKGDEGIKDIKNKAGFTPLDLAEQVLAAKKDELSQKVVTMIQTGEHLD